MSSGVSSPFMGVLSLILCYRARRWSIKRLSVIVGRDYVTLYASVSCEEAIIVIKTTHVATWLRVSSAPVMNRGSLSRISFLA